MTTDIFDSTLPAVIATGGAGYKVNGQWLVDNCVPVPPYPGVQVGGLYTLRTQGMHISVTCTGVGAFGVAPATFEER